MSLFEEVKPIIIDEISKGASIREACKKAKVSTRSFRNWVRWGERGEVKYVDFALRVRYVRQKIKSERAMPVIIRELDAGASVREACKKAKVSTRSFRNWVRWGREGDESYADFAARVSGMREYYAEGWDRRRRNRSDYLYLIREEWRGCVKVGVSQDPLRRMASLQTSCPSGLSLVMAIPVTDACDIEGELHRMFDHKRVRGEWFFLDDADMLYIERVARSLSTSSSHSNPR